MTTDIETSVDRNLAKLEAQLEHWGDRLKEVMNRASVTGQEVKVDARTQLEELKARLATARTRLDEAKVAGAEKWETLKHGVERTWKELEATFTKLAH